MYVRHVINTLRIRPELENYIESSAYASVFAKFSYVGHTLAKSSSCDSALNSDNVKNFHGSLTTVVRAQNDTTKTANITDTIFDRTLV